MARSQDKAVVMAELENDLKGVAKHFIERVYGPDGMPWGTKFADLEEIAVQLGQAVSGDMIEQSLARQAAAVPTDAETCSGCGRPVTPTEDTEPRAVATQVGAARWDEPKRYCPQCRAAFFPSDELCDLEWVTPADVKNAWLVFSTYRDKEWSFTDCVSRVVMERLSVTTAVAFDEHFRQFGTVAAVP